MTINVETVIDRRGYQSCARIVCDWGQSVVNAVCNELATGTIAHLALVVYPYTPESVDLPEEYRAVLIGLIKRCSTLLSLARIGSKFLQHLHRDESRGFMRPTGPSLKPVAAATRKTYQGGEASDSVCEAQEIQTVPICTVMDTTPSFETWLEVCQ